MSTTRVDQAVQRGLTGIRRRSPAALLAALGLVYLWFGGLKLAGASPVEDLLGKTLPWFDQDLTVFALGGVEVVIGLALLSRRGRPLALAAMVLHLVGTFLAFVTAPALMVQHGNPFLLTADGEFVMKNFVLISAGLVLLGLEHRRGEAATTGETRRGTIDVPHDHRQADTDTRTTKELPARTPPASGFLPTPISPPSQRRAVR